MCVCVYVQHIDCFWNKTHKKTKIHYDDDDDDIEKHWKKNSNLKSTYIRSMNVS